MKAKVSHISNHLINTLHRIHQIRNLEELGDTTMIKYSKNWKEELLKIKESNKYIENQKEYNNNFKKGITEPNAPASSIIGLIEGVIQDEELRNGLIKIRNRRKYMKKNNLLAFEDSQYPHESVRLLGEFYEWYREINNFDYNFSASNYATFPAEKIVSGELSINNTDEIRKIITKSEFIYDDMS